jgi:hypothetical protein
MARRVDVGGLKVYQKQWRLQKIARGICDQCPEPATPGKVQCQKCRDKIRLRVRGINKTRANIMLNSARLRAKHDMVECTLTADWFNERFARGCELTNLPFEPGNGPGQSNPYAPSVDRIKAGGPYSPDNCRMVLFAVNAAMQDWGADVYRHVAQAYIARN